MSTAHQFNAHLEKPIGSGYAPVNDVQVYYEVYGEGKPVILLHGAFMTIQTNWGELINELSKTRKVIALELQGHGRTPFSERTLSRVTLASDIEGVMDYLNIESADVVGYSFGGSVAYQFAVQCQQRLRKLVIISSAYKTEGWMSETNAAFKAMKPEFFTNTPLQEAYDAVAPDKTKWVPFLEKMIALAGQPYNSGDENIAHISSPVLLIAGDNDGLDKIELMKTYQLLGGAINADMSGLPKSQLAILPAQGHVSLMSQTQTLFSYLDSFLD
ncbi:MAG: alpha/beta fold hydrolase [Arcticibacter sp.]